MTTIILRILLLVCMSSPAWSQQTVDFKREHGYIDMSDGVRLKYTVYLPPGEGPWPVVLQYEGYNAGSFPDRAFEQYKHELLADGYALMGLSVRGTACSGGVFDVFNPRWGVDGAQAIEWAATQPWSNGKIGMFSLSFAGIMQLMTAIEQPPHLLSIAPGQIISDVYRDVGYPGGITNVGFPALWMAALQTEWAEAVQLATADGDAECLSNEALHPIANIPDNFALNGLQHPTDDEWHALRSTDENLDRIQIPVLGMQSFQDEQTGPRGGYHFDLLDPEQTWVVAANGPHLLYVQSPRFLSMLHDWFDFTLKGIDNGFASRPKVEIWHEVQKSTRDPAWVSYFERWPIPREPLTLYLGEAGVLSQTTQKSETTPSSYAYPLPGPAAGFEPVVQGTWNSTPVNTLGTLAWTSGALPADMHFAGEASADLWISASAPDVDVQLTLSEVRPDGQEVYIQRGWLRLSHRALDPERSSIYRPVHSHQAEHIADLPLNEAVLARVEILPFAHSFRAGSAIRLLLDTPSLTGFWEFLISPTPARILVHHDAEHPSRLVLGQLALADAPLALSACGELYGQACRADSYGIPDEPGPERPLAGTSPAGASDTAGSGAFTVWWLCFMGLFLRRAPGLARPAAR